MPNGPTPEQVPAPIGDPLPPLLEPPPPQPSPIPIPVPPLTTSIRETGGSPSWTPRPAEASREDPAQNDGFIQSCLSSRTVDTHGALASLKQEMEAMAPPEFPPPGPEDILGIHGTWDEDEDREPGKLLLEWLGRALPGFAFEKKQFLSAPGGLTVLATRGRPAANPLP